jgi:hypothetical protein
MTMNNAEILMKAWAGIAILKDRQKAITKEHVERIKRLQALMGDVTHDAKSHQSELFGSRSMTLSPEMEALLENPVNGL